MNISLTMIVDKEWYTSNETHRWVINSFSINCWFVLLHRLIDIVYANLRDCKWSKKVQTLKFKGRQTSPFSYAMYRNNKKMRYHFLF